MHETIVFGGRERKIAFTATALARLQRRFRFANASTWMMQDVLGVDLVTLSNTSFQIEARFHVLAAALECGERKAFPPAKIEAWYDDAVADGSIHEALWAAVACAFESGSVTTRPVDDFDAKSGAMRAVFFAATPQELDAAVKAFWDGEDGAVAGDDATLASRTSSSAAADAS